MAEATEHPVAGASPPEVYRPLSLLALAGFGVAVVYAAVLSISAVVALFNRQPLLLPLFLFLVPAAAVVLSWVARDQIRSSEGTRSGLAFTSWGIGLSLVCVLLYGSYYAATYFAVRQQASAVAEEYLDLLSKGDLARAFRLTIEPYRRPPDDSSLRDALEVEFNTSRRDQMSWSSYQQGEFALLVGGQEIQIQPLGVTQWDYDKGGYSIYLRYRISTPEVIGDALVALFGIEAPAGEYEGRQWQVLSGTSTTGFIQGTLKGTPRGERRAAVTQGARNDANVCLSGLLNDPDRAWLAAVPAPQRETAARTFERCRAFSFPTLAGAAVLGAAGTAEADLVVTRRAYEAGAWVRVPKSFWAPAQRRSEIIQAVRHMAAPIPLRRRGRVTLSNLAPFEEKDGVVRVTLTGQIMVLEETMTRPQFQVDARILMEATALPDKAPTDWRLRAMDLVSGHTAPTSLPGGLSPPPMAQQPPTP